MVSALLFLTVLTSEFDLAAADDRQCYYPNGQPESNNIPCNSSSVSSCCAPGDTCLSSGLCKNPTDLDNGNYWRDGCTDPSWGDSCPQLCVDGSFDLNGQQGNHLLSFCEFSGSDDAVFCCAEVGGDDCCTQSAQLFTTPAGTPYTVLSLPQSSMSSSTAPSSILASLTTTATSAASSARTSTQTQHSSNHLSTGAQAGIGLGVALCVLAIVAALLVWFLRRRKAAKLAKSAHSPEQSKKPPPAGLQTYSDTQQDFNGTNHAAKELPSDAALHELDEQQRSTEAPSYGLHERSYELSSDR